MSYDVGGVRVERPFRIQRLGHFGYHTPDLSGTIRFLTEDLGLEISDVDDFTSRVPELPKEHATGYFIRCAHDHHTLVIGSQLLVDTREPLRKGALINQLSWQVGSLKQIVDGVSYLEERAKLRRIGRDAPGSNWHAYAYCPDGYVNEIFYGMEQIGWDGRSKPSTMYDRAFHSLPPLPQMPEYQEVENVLAAGGSLEGYRFEQARPATYDVEGVLLPQPFRLTRLARVFIFVEDLEASLPFYEKVLGLRLSERRDIAGATCAFLRVAEEHSTLVLIPTSLKGQLGIGAACSFAVASFEQFKNAYAYLQERGVDMLQLPGELSDGVSFSFWVKGPDAVAVELIYGQRRYSPHGGQRSATAASNAPALIDHDGDEWFDPPLMGPLG